MLETLQWVDTTQTGAEWANSDPPAPHIPTLFVIPQASQPGRYRLDLILRSPHDIVDGSGALMFLNILLERLQVAYEGGHACETPKLDGTEVANLSPAYRVAANVPARLSPQQQTRFEANQAQKAAAGETDGPVRLLVLPHKQGAVLPGKHQRAALTLSEAVTRDLIAACKRSDITVTHAYHAAIAMVMRDIQKREAEDIPVKYVNYILRDDRKSCAEPYCTPAHAVSVYHSVSGQSLVAEMTLGSVDSPASNGRREEFQRTANLMKKFYEGVRDDLEHYLMAPSILGAACPPLPERGQRSRPDQSRRQTPSHRSPSRVWVGSTR